MVRDTLLLVFPARGERQAGSNRRTACEALKKAETLRSIKACLSWKYIYVDGGYQYT